MNPNHENVDDTKKLFGDVGRDYVRKASLLCVAKRNTNRAKTQKKTSKYYFQKSAIFSPPFARPDRN